MRANPVFTGVRRGLLAPGIGEAQRTYFACLVVQALALALWWPTRSLIDTLAAQKLPGPLLATVVALGATTAYYSLRAGAEELLLPGQQSLREWVLSTPLSIARIFRGSLFGHLWLVLCALLFSLPLLCVAFAVGGGEWDLLAHNLCAVVVQAMFFWVAGAVIYMSIGHYGQTTYVAIRVLLVGIYVLAAWRLPVMSQAMIAIDSLGAGKYTIKIDVALPPYQVFLLAYAAMILVLSVVLYAQMRRCRKSGQTT